MKDIAITSAEVLGQTPATTPRRRDGRATRVPAIIDASMNVFATEGNAGFTLRRIASDAGISLRTLQHYFSTREDLLRTTIEAFSTRYLERYRALARDKLYSPEARLEAIVDNVFSIFTGSSSSASAFVIECWSLAEHEEFVREEVAKIEGQFMEIFAGLVAKISPTLTSVECTLRAALLLSHLQGLLVFIRRATDNKPDLDAFRLATKVVWKAISKAAQ
jgi:AcrR family transcriptional regulator